MSLLTVPVIAIFTKFDGLEDRCYGSLRDEGKTFEEAMNEGAVRAQQIFQAEYLPRVMKTQFPPKGCVCLKGAVALGTFTLSNTTNSNGKGGEQVP